MLALNVPRRRHLIDNPKHTLAVKPPTISKLILFIRYFSGMPEQSDVCDPNSLQIVPLLPPSSYRKDTISTHLYLWQWEVHQWQIPLHDRSWIINCFLRTHTVAGRLHYGQLFGHFSSVLAWLFPLIFQAEPWTSSSLVSAGYFWIRLRYLAG